MKKIVFLVSIFITFFIIITVRAVEGTCSSHLGVNCFAGPDSDGSVVCNDGWRDSDENYNDTQLCFDCQNPAYSYSGCKNEQDLGKVTVESGKYGGLMSSQAMGLIENCKNEINIYNNLVVQYNECLNKKSSNNNENYYVEPMVDIQGRGDRLCKEIFGDNVFYNLQTKGCNCEEGYYFYESQKRCMTKNSFCQYLGAKQYLEEIKNCICEEGFVFVKNQCMTFTEDCQDLFGLNVLGKKSEKGEYNSSACFCKIGYTFNIDEKICVEDQKNIKNDLNSISPITNTIQINTNSPQSFREKLEKAMAEEEKKINDTKKIIESKPIKIELNKNVSSSEELIIPSNTLNLEVVKDQIVEEKKGINNKQKEKVNIFQKAGNLVDDISSFFKKVFNKIKFW